MSPYKINSIDHLKQIKKNYTERIASNKYQVLVCSGAGCVSSDCADVKSAIEGEIAKNNLQNKVIVYETGCMGTCAVGPVVLILPDRIFYTKLTPESAQNVIRSHIIDNKILTEQTFYDHSLRRHVPKIDDIDFFREQVRISLRNCGLMEYGNIEAYIARDGYAAAARALLEQSGGDIINEIKNSGLRGRGGAGFPTGIKWESGRNAVGDCKYLICNADEGDPGAFMDRSIIEGDPHTIIEGMIIGAYAIGANTGYVYVRAEYPIAVERLTAAITQARDYGLLGNNLFESDFSFDIDIRIGAGAFVCGEETALMASIEGDRGEPRQKPPFPFRKGSSANLLL